MHMASTLGQDTLQSTRLSHYVFTDFIKGIVKQTNGKLEETMLNYNSMTREMIFVQNGAYLALGQLENIDTVTIQERKFIPVKEVFYEVVPGNPVALYINHTCKVIPPGSPSGYGGTTQAFSVGNVSKIMNTAMSYSLKLPDDYKIFPETEFLLKKDDGFTRIPNVKQLTKIFPSKAGDIQDYVKKNNISFKRQEDMTKLIRFCNTP